MTRQMDNETLLEKVSRFFVTKIIIAIAVIVGLVTLAEWCGGLLDKTQLDSSTKIIMISIADSTVALIGYIVLFRVYEKRRIEELSTSTFAKNAIIGCIT